MTIWPDKRIVGPGGAAVNIMLGLRGDTHLPCPKCSDRFPSGEELCVHLVQEHRWHELAAAQLAHSMDCKEA